MKREREGSRGKEIYSASQLSIYTPVEHESFVMPNELMPPYVEVKMPMRWWGGLLWETMGPPCNLYGLAKESSREENLAVSFHQGNKPLCLHWVLCISRLFCIYCYNWVSETSNKVVGSQCYFPYFSGEKTGSEELKKLFKVMKEVDGYISEDLVCKCFSLCVFFFKEHIIRFVAIRGVWSVITNVIARWKWKP